MPMTSREVATMSTKEIAELTGKEHKNVLADCRTMFDGLGMHSAEFSAQYKDSTGRTLPLFNLPKDLTFTLVAGYSVELRHRIVTRWLELESKAAPAPEPAFALPKSYSAALIELAAQVEARIDRGVRAWGRIKATAAEQRELWREVGEALLVGRKLHKADRAFSQWCKATGFGDIHRNYRAASMWLATVHVLLAPDGVSDPIELRRLHTEQEASQALPEDLKAIPEPIPQAPVLAPEDAEKVVKLIHRAHWLRGSSQCPRGKPQGVDLQGRDRMLPGVMLPGPRDFRKKPPGAPGRRVA